MTAAELTIEASESREVAPACWPAFLNLEFSGSERGCKLTHSSHKGPLYIQKAFYPEGPDCAHVYLLHPPGGIVSGDCLEVALSLEKSAKVLMTTPGATRLYRARIDTPESTPLPQKVINKITACEASYAEWLPAETIVYNGAHIDLVTEVYLDESSYFCGWEIVCLGLQASNEPFSSGCFSQSFKVYRNKVPLIIDRLQFDASSPYLSSRCGFQSKPVYGSFILGPFEDNLETVKKSLLDMMEESGAQDCCSVTDVSDFIVLRYLGACSDQAKKQFVKAWEIARPCLVGRAAVIPRIWFT